MTGTKHLLEEKLTPALQAFNVHMDILSFFFYLFNFAVVGVISVRPWLALLERASALPSPPPTRCRWSRCYRLRY